MADLVATRTLVKSPPELWQELSDADGLGRHLGEFGEIRISRLEPEREIAWEAEHASGTVEIEASSWGTKVVLTADVAEAAANPAPAESASPQPEPEPEPEPEPAADPEPERRPNLLARWLFRERHARSPEPDVAEVQAQPLEVPPPEPEPEPAPEPAGPDVQRALALLEEALDSLGSAHHRPFSRG